MGPSLGKGDRKEGTEGGPVFAKKHPEELRSRGSCPASSFTSCTSNCRRRLWVTADALRTVISHARAAAPACEAALPPLDSPRSFPHRVCRLLPVPCQGPCGRRNAGLASGFLPRKAPPAVPTPHFQFSVLGHELGPRGAPLLWQRLSSFEHTVGVQSRSGDLLEEFASRVFAPCNQTGPASLKKQGRVGLAEGSRRSYEEEEHTDEDLGHPPGPWDTGAQEGCFLPERTLQR